MVLDPTLSADVVWSNSVKPSENVIENDSFSAQGVLSAGLSSVKNEFKSYRAVKGDTLKKISTKFSISIETLRSINPQIKKEVKKGNALLIPPVNGVIYSLQSGDTIDLVSERFQVSADLIKQYNSSYIEKFADVKGTIFIPYAKQKSSKIQNESLAKNENTIQFIIPAVGWNWGTLHAENAVDIANKCGTNVVASADGVVIKDETIGSGKSGWNKGYGVFVLLEHANGIKTRYAHLEKALVEDGDVVTKGQPIGTMGSTGNTETINGCHVHFEVVGSVNPFIVR